MSVDTNMFVATEEKNPFVIEKAVLTAFKNEFTFTNIINRAVAGVKRYQSRSYVDSKMLIISFEFNGESRGLHIFFNCDNDGKDIYEGSKIIFSLGSWGSSEEIMFAIAKEIKKLGNVYYTKNDCDSDFKLI